ncbi:MAG: DUF4197 domain-containing protein [Bacteroidetes bacterium]|nr:DUF4197 domain-containing protein [Bacteroidota bacterium]
MKRVPILIVGLVIISCTATQITQTVTEAEKAMEGTTAPTTSEVNAGLKEALTRGIMNGADLVSKTDGYFGNPAIKIPFPPDVKKVEDRLRQMGMGKEVDNFILAMNRGAEAAAKEAKPVFQNAITSMTIDDAWGILKGSQNAATQYLQRTTSAELKEKFKPHVQQALDQVSATRYYGDLVTTYNKIPFVEKVNPDLTDYATTQAILGLFVMIAEEEKKIRDNPAERTTDLLKKVFAYQK